MLTGYFISALLTMIFAYVVGRKSFKTSHPIDIVVLSIITGILWPLFWTLVLYEQVKKLS